MFEGEAERFGRIQGDIFAMTSMHITIIVQPGYTVGFSIRPEDTDRERDVFKPGEQGPCFIHRHGGTHRGFTDALVAHPPFVEAGRQHDRGIQPIGDAVVILLAGHQHHELIAVLHRLLEGHEMTGLAPSAIGGIVGRHEVFELVAQSLCRPGAIMIITSFWNINDVRHPRDPVAAEVHHKGLIVRTVILIG